MAITDKQRAAVSNLALDVLDTLEDAYGRDAKLGDAILVFEVDLGKGHGTRLGWQATTHRAVVAYGLASTAAELLRADYVDAD